MPDDLDSLPLTIATGALLKSVILLEHYQGKSRYPEVWRVLNAELVRRNAGAAELSITLARAHVAALPLDLKHALFSV